MSGAGEFERDVVDQLRRLAARVEAGLRAELFHPESRALLRGLLVRLGQDELMALEALRRAGGIA